MPRPKSSLARQELANFQPCRRTDPTPQESAALPITDKPPTDLDRAGKTLWVIVAEMQKSFHESQIPVSVTDAQAPALHAYCKTYSRWLRIGQSIKARERGLKESEKHKAMWVDVEGGDVKLRGEYKAEQELQKSLVKMGGALGLTKSTPLVAMQLNDLRGRENSPGFELLQFNQEAKRINDTVDAFVIEGETEEEADAERTGVQEER